ncbi:hypothetical protein [Blautia massiliensis (ex Durand et al. 2017)]|uniref:hypothetical protein n=1 Tax=Blautia massiliensis (ex Durand et al. 2017) TaxID=1737424 RepID=UPI00241F4051|nr:hypothetical protein [Blautia massiliensis (ex Durand et al. 2017)]MBN2956693.1 FIVAR domain-containing protein [Blautia massiliensis (ex Durand et al. 2017)]
MRRKNLWLRLSSCTMAALIATTSIVPVSAAEVEFQDEASAEAAETPETAEAPEEDAAAEKVQEAAGDEAEAEDVTLATGENAEQTETEDAAEAELSIEDGFSDGESDGALVQESPAAELTGTVQTGFGAANTNLEKGTYKVTISMMKADDTTAASMANSCIAGKGTLAVAEDGSAKLTVPIQAITMMGQTVYATDWKVYKGAVGTEATAAEYTTDKDGNVNSITFAIPDKAQDGVYVTMTMAAGRTQDAFLKADYANAEKDAAAVDTSALEATIAQADALDEMAYTKASWDGNKDAIEAAKTAAKAALEKKESQEAVDAANTALADAMKKLAVAGDQTDLRKVLDQAKALNENDYTAKSWKYVQDAIDKAETVIANRDTKRNLRSAKSSLTIWMGSLEVKYDTTALEKKIAQAEALKKDDYTAESWKAAVLVNAINAAKETIDNRGNKDNVHDAIENIENAIEKLVPVSNEVTVGRGNFEKKLAPGTYSLPIELLNGAKSDSTNQYTSANYMTQLSMAGGCFTGNATLVIHEDGTATLTAGVQAITAMGMTGAASDWTIYENTQDYLDGAANPTKGARFKARVDESKVQAGKKKPSKISFTIPDLKQNVVATRMYIEVMTVNQDACIGLDWSNVEKISDDTSETSTVEKEYVVNADTLTQLKNMKAGSTVKLDEDVTLTEDLTIKGGTLDLNGHILTQKDNLIMIKGDVTVIDSSAEKTGKITRERYSASSRSTTSISVQKGSFTADGVTIDGQIGNRIYNGTQLSLQDNPRVTVKLTNCTLINTAQTETIIGGSMNVAFAILSNGIDITIDSCTADKGVYVSGGTGEKTVINNSTLGELQLSGASAVVTKVTGTGRATIGADEMTISDDGFAGLSVEGTGDVALENVVSKNSASYQAALNIAGSGQVTVKSGAYANEAGVAVSSQGFPVKLEGGYFKGAASAVDGAYTTPEGKILGKVTEGEYAGYQTVVDGKEPEVADPVATVYDKGGNVARQISEENAALALSYATEGQTVKLNKDVKTTGVTYYKNVTFDLNGHVLTTENGITGMAGNCRVIDSSAEKTGKVVSEAGIFGGGNNVTITLDNITCEGVYVMGMSTGNAYIVNGTRVNGPFMLNAVMGGGHTYVQDSSWTIAANDYNGNPLDGKALLEGSTRTSQYMINQTGDHTFTVTVNDLGKAMRAFETLDASQYTKASYAAAKAIYDQIDGSADEDIQGDVVAQKAKELNDAVAALQAPASEESKTALQSAITAAKKVKAADYTAASYKTYKAAITAAETVLNGEDFSDTEVTAATKALTDAKAKLVKLKTQSITVSVKNTKNVVSKKYGDKAFSLGAKAKTTLTYKSSNTKIATVDRKGKVTIKAAGTVKITINAKATSTYKAATAKVLTIKIAKKAPTIKTKIGTKNLSYNTLKKRAQVFTLGTSVNSKGTLTYKKLSGSSAVSVNSKTGKLTVKKGLKKGTYRVKVQIKSAAKGNYTAGSRTVTVTVRVK